MIYADRFLANLRQRVIDDLSNRHGELGTGSVIGDDASATGMKYAKVVGIITGLKAALSHIDQIEDDMSGKKKASQDR